MASAENRREHVAVDVREPAHVEQLPRVQRLVNGVPAGEGPPSA